MVPSCSISATASCRRHRPSMSRSWSRSCATGSPPPHEGDDVKIAIILFNLGGPDSLEAVQPFLRNLFGDPAILRVPGFIRGPLASFLARRRAPTARAIYDKIGGASPILGQ